MKKILLEHKIRATFASNLRKLRLDKSLSQSEFAEVLGVGQKRVGAWEEDRGFPSMELVIRIVDFFGVELRKTLTEYLDPTCVVKKRQRLTKEMTLERLRVKMGSDFRIEFRPARRTEVR